MMNYEVDNNIERFALYDIKEEKIKDTLGIKYIKIGYRGEKITSISFIGDEYNISDDGYQYENSKISDEMNLQLNEYFMEKRKNFDIEYEIEGTEFQKKVWVALTEIPYGTTVSYKYLAEKIDSPKAYRAVGNANNKNRLPILVPCHRVIGSDKSLIGYAYGLKIKKYLINLEAVE